MDKIIEPRSLAGTMELIPADQIVFDRIKSVIENTYKKYGFLPLDTPSIELSQVLLAKAGGETEKQIYRFNKGDSDICLRFDLTVPLAKYVSARVNELTFPFKRYQIGKSYRGERPQRGRYREFYQCDIDIIGKDSLSLSNDAEVLCVIYDIYRQLDFGKITIMLNNRKIVTGFLEALNLKDKATEILRLVDKFDKIGEASLVECLAKEVGLDKKTIDIVMKFLKIAGTNSQKIAELKKFKVDNETFKLGVSELETVVNLVRSAGVPEEYFSVNFALMRGLDYYTGTVFETVLDNARDIGSVGGGGRYDNLAGYYTKQNLPGVGVSIGLSRLFFALQEKGLISKQKLSISKALIIPMEERFNDNALMIASLLRANNINVQTFFEDTKFKNKIAYADKLNIPFIIIIGEDEVKAGKFTLKNLESREQATISAGDIVNILRKN